MDKYQEEKANSSLFFLILIPVTMLILFAFYSDAQAEKIELDYIRRLENELDLTLADYDRRLWHEFGLWGTKTSMINQYADQMANEYESSGHFTTSHQIVATKTLSDTHQLKKQILRHMTYRSPLLVGNELIQRFSGYENLGAFFKGSNIITDLQNEFGDPEDVLDDLANYLHGPSKNQKIELENNEQEDEIIDVEEEEKEAAKEEALSIFSDLIDEAKELIIPVYQSTGTDIPENPVEPTALSAITDFADKLFVNYDVPILNSLQINEYFLNYYTSHCPTIEINDQDRVLKTPYGLPHEALIQNGRTHEAEQIIFNIFDAEQALKRSKASIYSVCFTYHLIDKYVDEGLQSLYLAEATAISTTIAVVSLGSVIIDSATLQYVIMLIDVVKDATKDYHTVFDGKTMTISISEYDITLNYRDFLRLFALLQTEDKLLQGINTVRETVLPGEFATAFQINATFSTKSFSLQREFSDHIDNEQGDDPVGGEEFNYE